MEPLQALIVDDDPDFRRLARKALEHGGFVIREAGDAMSALRQLQEGPPPQLVCTDLMLPVISGLHLCESIRADPRLRSLRILAVTARGSPQDQASARAAGADAVLVKPVHIATLTRKALALVHGASGSAEGEP